MTLSSESLPTATTETATAAVVQTTAGVVQTTSVNTPVFVPTSKSAANAAATTQNAASPTVTVIQNQSTNVGPIVGGVVGGIVGLVAIIGALFYVYWRGRQTGKQDAAHVKDRKDVPPPDDRRNQSSNVDLEKKGMEQNSATVTDDPLLGFPEVERAQNQHSDAPDHVQTTLPFNGDVPSGRLRYPDVGTTESGL